MTEKEKMLSGQMYDPSDPQLLEAREHARTLFQAYNSSSEKDIARREQILEDLLGSSNGGIIIEPPFFCDYGSNIHVGRDVFLNFNCTILDVCEVTIGDHTMIGPNVQIYTATHPLHWKERSSGRELGKPVVIGSYVWLGGGAIICPGVTIGNRSVIGAGSVVTRDVPDDVFAAGNPCRVIKKITEE